MESAKPPTYDLRHEHRRACFAWHPQEGRAPDSRFAGLLPHLGLDLFGDPLCTGELPAVLPDGYPLPRGRGPADGVAAVARGPQPGRVAAARSAAMAQR